VMLHSAFRFRNDRRFSDGTFIRKPPPLARSAREAWLERFHTGIRSSGISRSVLYR
jgi:hypothetical protein